MRRISPQVARRRHQEVERHLAVKAMAATRETGRSALFRLLDNQFEAIATRRPERSRWDPVVRWIAECQVTDPHGDPVTPALLAMTWRQVRLAREARGLSRQPAFDEDRDQTDEGGREMSDIKTAGSARYAFSGGYADALEEADRHSPLYLFLRENYDAILAHRPKHGGWHKFLAVLNEAGIVDGQGNVVSQRVLIRTWHKLNKTMLADRSRPAARVSSNAARPPPQGTDRLTGTAQGDPAAPPVIPLHTRQPDHPVDHPLAGSQYDRSIPPASCTPRPVKPPAPLTFEGAWRIQNLRNSFLESEGYPPETELEEDLFVRVPKKELPTFIAAV